MLWFRKSENIFVCLSPNRDLLTLLSHRLIITCTYCFCHRGGLRVWKFFCVEGKILHRFTIRWSFELSKLILLHLQSIVQVLPSKRLTLTNDGRRAGTRNRSKVQIIEKHLVRFLQFRKGDVHKWHHAILNNFWALPPASRVFITEAFMMSSHNPWPPPIQWRHLWTTP